MITTTAKIERADQRVKLGGGWYLSNVAPIMSFPIDKDCGLIPSDVVYYRNRRAIVKAVTRVYSRVVILDRPIVVSRPQMNAAPSVYVFREIAKL